MPPYPPNMNDLIDKSEAELYETLGKELTSKQAFPLSGAEALGRGKAWFNAHLTAFRSVICSESSFKFLTEENDTKTAMIAVAELIAKVTTGVAPVTVAALLVKIGVKKICQNRPATEGDVQKSGTES